MKNQVLQILCEQIENGPNELSPASQRYRAMSDMCSRYNLTPMRVETPTPGSPLLLVGSTAEWLDKAHVLYSKDMHLIIKGNPAAYAEYDFSIVGENTAGEAKKLLEYLKKAERTRIAIFGPNRQQFASNYYVRTFLAKAAEMDIPMDEASVFWDSGENRAGETRYRLEDCYEAFREVSHHFDAVICYNTQAAIFLCSQVRKDGIRIPEDLFVIGRGDLRLASAVSPSITTVSFSEDEVGQQFVKLYRYLNSNPYVKSVTVLLDCHITPRESTACFPLPENNSSMQDASFLNEKRIGSDIYLSLGRIEQMLNSCTDMDFRILERLHRGESREKIAEQEFVTLSTVRYRLKRMLKLAGTETVEALFALLDRYHINTALFQNLNENQ